MAEAICTHQFIFAAQLHGMKHFFTRITLLVTSFFYLFNPLSGQEKRSLTSAEIYQAMQKLNVLGSVLYIAAHPDDENTRLITYLSNEKLYRTGYLSLTRGDGGQNLIGDEQGVELGLIRTQELLAARRVDGGEQFFSRAFDFGYSKNPEETFTKWDKEKILSDVVWVIRKFQPDVIITRFPTTGEGGHGHHTASAILANEAFTAAADPKRFPEQLRWVKPWQAQRILWNTFNFGAVNTIQPDQFKIDVGGFNTLLGKSYGEIAAASRSQHKSQGFGVPASRGEAFENFKTTGGTAPAASLLDHVNTSWARLPGGEAISKQVSQLIQQYDLLHPERSVPALVSLYKQINALPDQPWKTQKLREVQELLIQCSGLYLEAFTRVPTAVQGDELKVQVAAINRLGAEVVLDKVVIGAASIDLNTPLRTNVNLDQTATIRIPKTYPLTQPYWLREKMAEGYFQVSDMQKIGQPDVDPAYTAGFSVTINGLALSINCPVRYKYTDPVKGEIYQPLVVLPPVELRFVNDNNLVIGDTATRIQVQFYANKTDTVSYQMVYQYSGKWKVKDGRFVYGPRDNRNNFASAWFAPAGNRSAVLREQVRLVATSPDSIRYTSYHRRIAYDHIPTITYFKPAETNLVAFDLKTEHHKIGYITGAGDKVPQALELMGYEVTLLDEKNISRNHLDQFDAIITGVRAYNTNEWLNSYYDQLMGYVAGGGNLIVQYNTSSNIGPVKAKIGPYAFDISRARITDENAAVRLLQPGHAAFNYPNKITATDFEGWIQERSIYHGSNWDKEKMTALISMNDPGENADEGSLLVAPYGKGFFTYTGLVFFRELPAGVPGAYRLLANLIALNKKKGF